MYWDNENHYYFTPEEDWYRAQNDFDIAVIRLEMKRPWSSRSYNISEAFIDFWVKVWGNND